MDGLDDQNPRD